MRLPQKGNWVKIDSDNLGNFNPLVDNQFCRGVLVPCVDVTQLFSLREHAIAKEPGSSYFSLGGVCLDSGW